MIRITFLEVFWSHGSNWFKSWFRKHSKKTRSKFLNMMNSSSLMKVVLASLKPSKSRCQKLSLYFGEIRKVFSSYFVCWKPIWFTLVSWRSVVSGYWWMMPRVITRTQLLPCSLPQSWWRGDFDYDENFSTMWNWLCNENFLASRLWAEGMNCRVLTSGDHRSKIRLGKDHCIVNSAHSEAKCKVPRSLHSKTVHTV